MTSEVVEVGRLLDDLAAAPVGAPPPCGSGRRVQPAPGHGLSGPLAEPLAQLRQRLEAAEVVADRDDEPPFGDEAATGGARRRPWPRAASRRGTGSLARRAPPRAAARLRRDAELRDVRSQLVEEPHRVGRGDGAMRVGDLLGALETGARDADERRPPEALERREVVRADPAGTDQDELEVGRHQRPRVAIAGSRCRSVHAEEEDAPRAGRAGRRRQASPTIRWTSDAAAARPTRPPRRSRRSRRPASRIASSGRSGHRPPRSPPRFQGIETHQLLRTIVVRRGDDDYLFVLVPAGRRFDWPKLRELLGVRRMTLPDAEEARAVTGYERYTITPFGSTRPWPVIADAAIVDEPVVAIGGGGFGVNLHLAPADLVAALDARVADVSVPEAPHDHDHERRSRPLTSSTVRTASRGARSDA